MTHWIEETEVRKRFWVFAKDTLGLTEDEVHEALGRDSVKDFDGDMKAAKVLLEDYARRVEDLRFVRSLQTQEPEHAEARAIAYTDVYAPDGTRICVTAREGATGGDVAATAWALWQGLEALKRIGWATNGRYVKERQMRTEPQQQVAVAEGPPQPPGPPGGNGHDGGSETFLVESITAQLSTNGHRYYAIRGGRVKKHGASAWPEVAEPQILAITDYDITNLEVGQPWDVSGWNIQAVGEIPEGKQYPNKVTAFAPSPGGNG